MHHFQTVFVVFITIKSLLLWSQKMLSIYDFLILGKWLDTSGGLQTWTGDSLQRLAPGQKVAGVTELRCVPEVFLGCHTTVHGCAKWYDHFSYIENQSNILAWLRPERSEGLHFFNAALDRGYAQFHWDIIKWSCFLSELDETGVDLSWHIGALTIYPIF